MKSDIRAQPPETTSFLNEAGKLASQFGWRAKSFERDAEVVLVALTETDRSFDRFVWVYDTKRIILRCMLVSNLVVPEKMQTAILELCAWINQGLPFGCVEYSFSDHIVVFKDSADLDWGPLDKVIGGTTSRVLNLGTRYTAAIQDTLNGEAPRVAVERAEKSADS